MKISVIAIALAIVSTRSTAQPETVGGIRGETSQQSHGLFDSNLENKKMSKTGKPTATLTVNPTPAPFVKKKKSSKMGKTTAAPVAARDTGAPTSTASPSNSPTPSPTASPIKNCFPDKAALQGAVDTYIDNACIQDSSEQACIDLRNLWGWPMGTWCTSLITDMSYLFYWKSTFNEDIGSWDVSSVTDMNRMFLLADSFNQNITAWNVGSVTNMASMFSADKFNQNIGSWNVSSVTNMEAMFNSASEFNQNITGWNVGKVTNMNYMFTRASKFNQNLCPWAIKLSSIPRSVIFQDSGCTFKDDPPTGFCKVQTCS